MPEILKGRKGQARKIKISENVESYLDRRGCDIVLMNGCGFLTSLLQTLITILLLERHIHYNGRGIIPDKHNQASMLTWTSTWSGPCLQISWICRET